MSKTLDIDLWLYPPQSALSAAQQLAWEPLLDSAERERGARFARAADRAVFLQTRVLLRRVLGAALQQDPQAVMLATDAHGKPRLADARRPLHFNLSHTNGLAALALCRAGELGVDVEWLPRKVELMALARRYFAMAEVAALEDSEDDATLQRELFFAQWTLKEAWLKAKGLGLRVPLDAFWFERPQAGKGDIVLRCAPQLQEEPEQWSFWLHKQGEHRLALAVHNPGRLPLRVHQRDAGALLRQG